MFASCVLSILGGFIGQAIGSPDHLTIYCFNSLGFCPFAPWLFLLVPCGLLSFYPLVLSFGSLWAFVLLRLGSFFWFPLGFSPFAPWLFLLALFGLFSLCPLALSFGSLVF